MTDKDGTEDEIDCEFRKLTNCTDLIIKRHLLHVNNDQFYCAARMRAKEKKEPQGNRAMHRDFPTRNPNDSSIVLFASGSELPIGQGRINNLAI